MTAKPRILYACKANGGRSVVSRVLTARYGGDAVDAFSAGSEPGDRIHPEVADVLTGLGLDVSGEVPKGFDAEATYDVVVTQGCGESCPVFSGARYVDWPLDDPKGQDEATVRRIVADIDARVRALLGELLPGRELPPSVIGPSRPDRTRDLSGPHRG
ncbi:MAG: low molecular weight phosphatase family protein, partial [Actinomycetes bacterium]